MYVGRYVVRYVCVCGCVRACIHAGYIVFFVLLMYSQKNSIFEYLVISIAPMLLLAIMIAALLFSSPYEYVLYFLGTHLISSWYRYVPWTRILSIFSVAVICVRLSVATLEYLKFTCMHLISPFQYSAMSTVDVIDLMSLV